MTDPRDQTAFVIDRATLEAEVRRIVDAAEAAGVTVRVLGSIGVALHSHDAAAIIPSFARTYADIDFAAYRRDARGLATVMGGLGYRDDREVYVGSEGGRSIFDDPARRIHVDVFYDRLEFCHVIPLAGRLEVDRPTIPVAELLLSKLQIVRINEKDVVDIILLLLDHPLGSGDADTIDLKRIAGLCADDWGLWRTLTQNLGKVVGLAATYPQLDDGQRERVRSAAAGLKAAIDGVGKSMAWRMRDRVGDRRQWWTDVDEVR
ncbi:MAG: hypothetical protein ACLGIJ_13280 [Candidatus Limnocylindria bacterium]